VVIPAGGAAVSGHDAISAFFADLRSKGFAAHKITVEKVLGNAETNAKAAFEAAATLAGAKTLPELARMQANFVDQKLAGLRSVQGAEAAQGISFTTSARRARTTGPRTFCP
jgi:hypothetical protein